MNITISDELFESIKKERLHKGKSLIQFPNDFTIIDIETTGYSTNFDEILEVGAIKYQNNKKIEEFSSLINTKIYDNDIIEKTGITNEMLSTAPKKKEVLEKFYRFIGNDILVGYNVNFDINFLYDNIEEDLNVYLQNDFVDIMRIAKKYLKQLEHHRLKDVIEFYNIDIKSLHRSLNDCEACKQCLDSLKQDIQNNTTLEELFKHSTNKNSSYSHLSKLLKAETDAFDEAHPLYSKYCVFTGVLDKMTRKQAMQIVLNLGGNVEDRITKNTNFLIIGNLDFCKSIKEGKSNKHKKALQYANQGQDIQIIAENDFYDMIFNY